MSEDLKESVPGTDLEMEGCGRRLLGAHSPETCEKRRARLGRVDEAPAIL